MTKRLVGEPRRLVGAEGPPRSMCCGGTVLCCIGSAFSFPCRGPWLLGHASAVTHPPSLIRRHSSAVTGAGQSSAGAGRFAALLTSSENNAWGESIAADRFRRQREVCTMLTFFSRRDRFAGQIFFRRFCGCDSSNAGLVSTGAAAAMWSLQAEWLHRRGRI